MVVLGDNWYRCRICQKKSDKIVNSYFLQLSDNVYARVCRHCYLRITRYLGLWRKINDVDERDLFMKLPIKHKYFEQIKEGRKTFEYRDAHLTLVDEKTGETITKYVKDVNLVLKDSMPDEYVNDALFDDEKIIRFELE